VIIASKDHSRISRRYKCSADSWHFGSSHPAQSSATPTLGITSGLSATRKLSRNASAVSDAPRSTPEVYLSLTTGRVRYSCLKEATPVRKRLCSFNGVAVMKKTRGIGDAANRSASGLGSIVVCERKLEARSLVGGQRKRTKPVGVGRHQGARSEWECHAATPASRGGERSWSWAAESLSRTTMGPPHLGQRQRGRGSLAADVCCSTCGCGIVPSS